MQTTTAGSSTTWRAYDSIAALPPGFWNGKVARGDISKYAEFIRLMEKHHSDTEFLCLVAYVGDQIVGCAYFHLSERDLAEQLPGLLALPVRMIRYVMPRLLCRSVIAAGAEATDGDHWWYDENHWSWKRFFSELNRQIQRYPRRFDWTIFRSYVLADGPLPDEIGSLYQASGFVEQEELLKAELTLQEGIAGESDYLSSLSQAHRYTVRKALKKKDPYGLQYEDLESFSDKIEEIYPLYLATWKNATELSTEVVPQAFFEDLSKETALRPRIQVVRDRSGAIVAFGLTMENDHQLCLWFVGMDYAMNREMSLIYHVYWLAILRAIRKGIRRVNLGVTTYFVKQKFGAELHPTKCFVRFCSPTARFMRYCLGRR